MTVPTEDQALENSARLLERAELELTNLPLMEVTPVAGNPRNGRPYRRLCTQQRALGLPCWICGHDIDPGLDARDPWSWTLDHAVPLSRGGSLLDPANARSAHRRCNSARGNRSTTATVERTSRRW